MERKLLELKAKRQQHLTAAETAIGANDGAAYDAAMKQVAELNNEIEKISKLLDEQNRFAGDGKGKGKPGLSTGKDEGADDLDSSAQLTKLLCSKGYKKQLFAAIKNGVSSKNTEVLMNNYPDLLKAMTLGGGTPVGSDGGFLAPPDFQTRVIELAKDMTDLSAYAHVETVGSHTGWRIVELAASRNAMNAVGEGSKIPLGDTPKFKRIDFSCKTYADRIAISGELMEDTDALMEYLARWFAAKYVATKNSLILQHLNALELGALDGESDEAKLKAIKGVLNKDLRSAVSKQAIILTNQNGYDELDNLSDEFGRPYIKPDISGDFDRLKGRPVVYGDNDVIEDIAGDGVNYSPLYIGHLASFVSLFVRKGIRMDVTNVGGEAWENGGYEVRVMCSMDCQQIDDTAMVKCGLPQA